MQQQQQQQQQQLLRRFAAKVAASHRFLRFLVFKSQVCRAGSLLLNDARLVDADAVQEHQDLMMWLTRGASGGHHQQQQQQQQHYRLFAVEFASRKSVEIPSQVRSEHPTPPLAQFDPAELIAVMSLCIIPP